MVKKLIILLFLCAGAYGQAVPPFTTTFMRTVLDDDDAATARATLGVPIKDEDDMASDSASHIATQQSIKAYVDSLTASGTGDTGEIYEDRGAASSFDFTEADLTEDGTWNDLDLSSIVPAGASAVNLMGIIQDDAAASILKFRPNGYGTSVNVSQQMTQVANVDVAFSFVVGLDSDRYVEYWASNLTWSSIDIAVTGWWGSFDYDVMIYENDEIMVTEGGEVMIYE